MELSFNFREFKNLIENMYLVISSAKIVFLTMVIGRQLTINIFSTLFSTSAVYDQNYCSWHASLLTQSRGYKLFTKTVMDEWFLLEVNKEM